MEKACCEHPEERHVEAGGIAYCLDCLAYLKHVHSYRAAASDPDLLASASAPLWQAAAEMDGPDGFGVGTRVVPPGAEKPSVQREIVDRIGKLKEVWNTDAPEGMAWKCPDCDLWATLGGNVGYHAEKTNHGVPVLMPLARREGHKTRETVPVGYVACPVRWPCRHMIKEMPHCDLCGRAPWNCKGHLKTTPPPVAPADAFTGNKFENCKPSQPERCRCGASTVGARVESNGVHQQHGVTGCGVVRTPAEVVDALVSMGANSGRVGPLEDALRAAVAHLRQAGEVAIERDALRAKLLNAERGLAAAHENWRNAVDTNRDLIAERDALAAKLEETEGRLSVRRLDSDALAKERDQLAATVAELEDAYRRIRGLLGPFSATRESSDLLTWQTTEAVLTKVLDDRDGLTIALETAKVGLQCGHQTVTNLTAKLAASEEARHSDANAYVRIRAAERKEIDDLTGAARAEIADLRKRLAESGTYALCPSMRRTSFGIAQCMRPKGHVAVERNEHTDGTEYWRDEDAV